MLILIGALGCEIGKRGGRTCKLLDLRTLRQTDDRNSAKLGMHASFACGVPRQRPHRRDIQRRIALFELGTSLRPAISRSQATWDRELVPDTRPGGSWLGEVSFVSPSRLRRSRSEELVPRVDGVGERRAHGVAVALGGAGVGVAGEVGDLGEVIELVRDKRDE